MFTHSSEVNTSVCSIPQVRQDCPCMFADFLWTTMHRPTQDTSSITDIWSAPARDPLELQRKCLSFPQGCDVELLILCLLLEDRSLPI